MMIIIQLEYAIATIGGIDLYGGYLYFTAIDDLHVNMSRKGVNSPLTQNFPLPEWGTVIIHEVCTRESVLHVLNFFK